MLFRLAISICLVACCVIRSALADSNVLFELDLVKAKDEGKLNAFNKRIVDSEEDPYYGGNGRYEALSLVDLLKEAPKEPSLDIRFVALDGYLVTSTLGKLPLEKAYVATRDLLAKQGESWRAVGEGREMMSPAPFILVWSGRYEKGLPIPHQLAKIQILSPDTSLNRAVPKEKEALTGYSLFKSNCSSCHSVNGQGGVIGPELNVPRNVTEYWRKEDILTLLEDPANMRWGSRMPAFSHLSTSEREEIYRYLASMKQQKVCSSKGECNKNLSLKR